MSTPSERLAHAARLPRKPRAGPLLDPDEVIALALNSIDFKWWPKDRHFRGFSEVSIPVRTVVQALRLAGWKIVPMEKDDYDRHDT